MLGMIIFCGSYVICGILGAFLALKSMYKKFGFNTRGDIALGVFITLGGWFGLVAISLFEIVYWWENKNFDKPLNIIHIFDRKQIKERDDELNGVGTLFEGI